MNWKFFYPFALTILALFASGCSESVSTTPASTDTPMLSTISTAAMTPTAAADAKNNLTSTYFVDPHPTFTDYARWTKVNIYVNDLA